MDTSDLRENSESKWFQEKREGLWLLVVLKPFLGCIRSLSQWIYLQLQFWRVVRDVIGDLVDAVRARLQRVFSLCQLKNSVRTNHTVYVLICHCISDLVRAQCMVGLPAVTHLLRCARELD